MKAPYSRVIPLLLLISVMLTIVGCSGDDKTVDPNNSPPVINSITIDPDTFVAGIGIASIDVSASDPDGDKLSYEWAMHGQFIIGVFNSGSHLEITNCCTIEEIETGWVVSIVKDDNDAAARDSVQVWVIPRE